MRLWTSVSSSGQNLRSPIYNKTKRPRLVMDSPASKNKSVFMPANSWSRVTHFGGAKWPSKFHFCVFRPEFKPKPSSHRIRNRGQEGRLSRRLAVNIHHPCNLAKRGYNIRNPSGIRLLHLGDMAIAEIRKEAMTDTRYKTPIAPTQ